MTVEKQLLRAYQSTLKECETAFNKINLESEEGFAVRFVIFSANLTNFLPSIPISEHKKLYKQLLLNIAFEGIDRKLIQLSDVAAFEGNLPLLENRQPFIFCSFHLGSYRTFANYLVRKNYDFTVIVRSDLFKEQNDTFLPYVAKMQQQYGTKNDVRIVNAEDPTILVKLIRELKEGRSLVVYLDGNLGANENNLEDIQFLSQKISVRKGIPLLSYLSGVSLLPVFAHRKPNYQNVVEIGTPIHASQSQSRNEFVTEASNQLFGQLAGRVKQFPHQWEAWNYVHNFIQHKDTGKVTDDAALFSKPSYSFNHLRYSLFDLQHTTALFDKKTYTTIEISGDLKDYLFGKKLARPKAILGTEIFNQLVANQIIV